MALSIGLCQRLGSEVERCDLLYTLARPSLQPEAPRLAALSAQQMEAFAGRIRALGVETKVSL